VPLTRGPIDFANMGPVECSMKYTANVAEFNCTCMQRMVGI